MGDLVQKDSRPPERQDSRELQWKKQSSVSMKSKLKAEEKN